MKSLLQRGRGVVVEFPLSPMRYSFFLAGFLFLSSFQAPLRAQEAAPTAPDAVAPPARPETAPKRDFDPARRRENRREAVEVRLRALMNDLGLNDVAKQDALVAYLAEDEAGKVAVRDAAKRLMISVKRGAKPEQMRELISLYRAALETDKTRRVAAQAGLDAKIGFSRDPRLEALLWLFGVLGEAQPGVSPNWLGPRGGFNSKKDGASQRRGVAEGIVAGKGENWVEVRENGARSERYHLPGATDAPATQNVVSQAMAAAKIGDRVRLEWVWNEGRHVVKLEAAPEAGLAPKNTPAKP